MPRSRIVVAVLAVALVGGFAIGAATALPSILNSKADRSGNGSTLSPKASRSPGGPGSPAEPTKEGSDPEATPDSTPTSTEKPQKPDSYVALVFDTGNESGRPTFDIPEGWTTDRVEDGWYDVLDPTQSLRLRARLWSRDSDSPKAAAEEHVQELKTGKNSLQYVTVIGREPLSVRTKSSPRPIPAYEIRYTYLSKKEKRTRYAVERFIGEHGGLMLSCFSWERQMSLVEPSLDRMVETFDYK